MSEPEGDNEVNRWLENKPLPVRLAVSSRIGLRLFPEAWHKCVGEGPVTGIPSALLELLLLRAARAITIGVVGSSIADISSDPELHQSYYSTLASLAHMEVTGADPEAIPELKSALTSIKAAGHLNMGASRPSFRAIFSAKDDIGPRTEADPASVFSQPLWGSEAPDDELAEATELFLGLTQSNTDPWRFWARWFHGFYVGRPLPVELLRRVLIEVSDGTWAAGVEAVAERIAEIEADYLAETTHVEEHHSNAGSETARFEGSLPKLILSNEPIAPSLVETAERDRLTFDLNLPGELDSVQFAVTNLQAALEHALESSAENGFSKNSAEAEILSLALFKLPKEPRYLIGPLDQAYRSFDRKLEIGEYPKDGALEFLSNQCRAHVMQFAELDAKAKEHLESFSALPEVSPLSSDVVEQLRDVPGKVEPVVTEAVEDVISDIAENTVPGQPPSKFGIWYLGQMLSQIWIWLEKAKKHSALAAWILDLLGKIF